MRPVSILLGILTIVLGVVCIQLRRSASDQLAVAQQQTQTVSNALRQAQTDLATYKTQQEAVIAQQSIVMTQLVQQAAATKAADQVQIHQAVQQAETLTQELATTRKTAQEEQDRLTTLEKNQAKLSADSAALTEQLRTAKQQLAAQEKTPPATATPAAPQVDQQTRRDLESLQARWNSLPALRDQVCTVKRQLREERIAADKRLEAEADAAGNHGTLMHKGYWHTTTAVIPEAR